MKLKTKTIDKISETKRWFFEQTINVENSSKTAKVKKGEDTNHQHQE